MKESCRECLIRERKIYLGREGFQIIFSTGQVCLIDPSEMSNVTKHLSVLQFDLPGQQMYRDRGRGYCTQFGIQPICLDFSMVLPLKILIFMLLMAEQLIRRKSLKLSRIPLICDLASPKYQNLQCISCNSNKGV